MLKFLALVVLLPESLPFVVMASPAYLPSVFEPESEREVRVSKRELEQSVLAYKACLTAEHHPEFSEFVSESVLKQELARFGVLISNEQLPRPALQAMGFAFSIPVLFTSKMISKRLSRKWSDLLPEDLSIKQAGVDTLEDVFVRDACMDRGIPWKDCSIKQCRKHLKIWVENRSEDPNEDRVLALCAFFALLPNRDPRCAKTLMMSSTHK
jgi:hypothetical protein